MLGSDYLACYALKPFELPLVHMNKLRENAGILVIY